MFNVAYHFVDRNADTDRIDHWLDTLNGLVADWHRRFLGEHSRAWGVTAANGFRRSTYLVDRSGRIRHVIVDVDVRDHARQILATIAALEAGPRPIGPRTDLVTLRRRGAEAG